jgi:predicted MFS family arabinose efflux permease
LLPNVETSAGGTFLSHLGVVRSGAVVGVLALTVLALMASFVVLTYVRPLLENRTGFGTEGIGLMLAIFGLASIPGTLLGGYAADRWGYRISITVMLAVLLDLRGRSGLYTCGTGDRSDSSGLEHSHVCAVSTTAVPLDRCRSAGTE